MANNYSKDNLFTKPLIRLCFTTDLKYVNKTFKLFKIEHDMQAWNANLISKANGDVCLLVPLKFTHKNVQQKKIIRANL